MSARDHLSGEQFGPGDGAPGPLDGPMGSFGDPGPVGVGLTGAGVTSWTGAY